MAYYDSRPYPPADYPEPPSYYYGANTHGGSHSTDVMPAHHAGGSRDAYYRSHPAKDAYEYGYDDYYPHDSKRSRKGRHRAHSASGYYEDPYDDYEPRSRLSRHHDERRAYIPSTHKTRTEVRQYKADLQPGGREKYAYSPSTSRSPPRRRRSLSERALGALGLGDGSKHRDSDRGRSRGRHNRTYSYSPSPSRGGHHHRGKSEARMAQAVKAAIAAGAVEAFRARKEPGDWSGPKGKRVLTAAIAAGGTDGLVDRNPDKHSKRHIIESTLAGLATNRVVNGSRSRSRSRRRSRSRSKGRSKTKDAALMGLLATAGKEAYDRYQKSHSRSRPRHWSDSRDGYDDYDSRPRHKKRSKSVSDYINKGMAALGIDDEKRGRSERDDRRRRHHRSSRYDDYSDDDRYSDDEYYRRHPSPPRTRHSKDVSRPYYIPTSGARSDEGYGHYSRPGSRPTHDQSRDWKQECSDADDSTDDRKKLKKLNRETFWATSLAAATTIHAAHTLNENMEKHKERTKQLKEGEITRDEARRRRRKNQLSDLASIGVAALSIHTAVSEWKNFDSKRRERATLHKAYKERSRSLSGTRNSSSQPQRTQSQRPPQTMYPDEIEENWSVPDRSRSTGGRSVFV
ncbi:hypothetical protein BDW62DRAFT_148405 [Aspergillus aurantiobrunneus]